MRLRLYDLRTSRLPNVIGCCSSDIPTIRDYVNAAQERLLYCKEAGDDGWWGTWAEMRFALSQSTPYLTLPREVARMEVAVVCRKPVTIHNQLYEYLEYGNGRMPRCGLLDRENKLTQIYQRNDVPTFVDLTPGNFIAVYFTDPGDVGKRVFLQGVDINNNLVTSQDGNFRVQGQYVTMEAPFVQSPMQFNQITGLQKDVTSGPVHFFGVDPVTGIQTLIHVMEAGETVSGYRRYYFDKLPLSCCPSTNTSSTIDSSCCTSSAPVNTTPIDVRSIVKLQLIPVVADPDYCLLQNKEAIISECESIRYEGNDSPTAKGMAAMHHQNAVRYLNGELGHYMGIDTPAILFRPFGSAQLKRQKIGALM